METLDSLRALVEDVRGQAMAAHALLGVFIEHLPPGTARTMAGRLEVMAEELTVQTINDPNSETFLRSFETSVEDWMEALRSRG